MHCPESYRASFRGRRFVPQTLTLCESDQSSRPLAIVYGAIVPNEIKLPEIPMQIFLADVMVHAHDAALYQRKRAFGGIGVNVAANLFFGRMRD
jgi:hypothetical protein